MLFELLPVDVNTILEPLIDKIQPLLLKLSLLVGGIFGLYILLFIFRTYYDRKSIRLLKDIRYDLDNLNKHFGALSSDEKKGIFGKMVHYFKGEKHYHIDSHENHENYEKSRRKK